MTRSAFLSAAAALLCSFAFAPAAFAQTAKATPATPTATSPPAKAKFVPLIKGVANIEVMEVSTKTVGKDIVTVLKIKNVSDGSIGLLRVDELWYNKKLQHVTGDTAQVRRAMLPGEIVEITLKAPIAPDLYRSQYSFSHANGTIKAKSVKKIE